MPISKKLSIKKKIYKHSLSESQIQSRFIKLLKNTHPDAWVVKLSDKWVSGIPDVLMVKDGVANFYEIKSDRGEVSKIQKETHKQLKEAGASVFIVRLIEGVLSIE